MGDYTTNLRLYKPAVGESGWGLNVNANWDIIETIGLSGYALGYSGFSGYSGIGDSGYSGYSGSGRSGYSGWSGKSGYSGYSGDSGISGYSGSGESGYSGYSGIDGSGGGGTPGGSDGQMQYNSSGEFSGSNMYYKKVNEFPDYASGGVYFEDSSGWSGGVYAMGTSFIGIPDSTLALSNPILGEEELINGCFATPELNENPPSGWNGGREGPWYSQGWDSAVYSGYLGQIPDENTLYCGIETGGSDHVSGDVLQLDGGNSDAYITVTGTTEGGISSWTLTSGGTGYVEDTYDLVAVTGSGTGATFTVNAVDCLYQSGVLASGATYYGEIFASGTLGNLWVVVGDVSYSSVDVPLNEKYKINGEMTSGDTANKIVIIPSSGFIGSIEYVSLKKLEAQMFETNALCISKGDFNVSGDVNIKSVIVDFNIGNEAALDDATFSFAEGGFTGGLDYYYLRVTVDSEGEPDTFSLDNDGEYIFRKRPITASWQLLANGFGVTFYSTSGHSLGDTWVAEFYADDGIINSQNVKSSNYNVSLGTGGIDGSSNTTIGYNAAPYLSGSYNVNIGYGAGRYTNDQSGTFCITNINSSGYESQKYDSLMWGVSGYDAPTYRQLNVNVSGFHVLDSGEVGSELLLENDFATYETWGTDDDCSIAGNGSNMAVWSYAVGTGTLTQDCDIIDGAWYLLTYTIEELTAGLPYLYIMNGEGGAGETLPSYAGTHTICFQAEFSGTFGLYATITATDILFISSVYLQRITGGNINAGGTITASEILALESQDVPLSIGFRNVSGELIFKLPPGYSGDTVYYMPSEIGTSGQFLKLMEVSGTSGWLMWDTVVL